ncbi:hypothetical protein B7493_17165, partial [Mycobacterium tuberculosis variant bovis]
RQQTAHIYEIGSRSVGGAGKSGCKSWLGSVGWRAVSAPTQANPLWAICTSIGQVDSRPHTSTRLVPDPWVGPGKAAVRVG